MHVAQGDQLNVKSPGATELQRGESTVWQAGSGRVDWLVDWLAYGPREVPRSDGDWKPFFIRSRVQIHSVL